jgi:hypothetical protein
LFLLVSVAYETAVSVVVSGSAGGFMMGWLFGWGGLKERERVAIDGD